MTDPHAGPTRRPGHANSAVRLYTDAEYRARVDAIERGEWPKSLPFVVREEPE